MADDKPDGFSIFMSLVLAFMVAAPIQGVATAWSAQVLWEWFLAERYGAAGPSTIAMWYGIAVLVDVLTLGIRQVKRDGSISPTAIASRTLTYVFVLGCILLSARIMRAMFGW